MTQSQSRPADETPNLPARRSFTDDELRSVKSFQDAVVLVGRENVRVASDEYGTGFEVLDDKSRLVKVPFILVEHKFNKGDKGVFVSMSVVTEKGDKFIVNDGSTGIRDQLLEWDFDGPLYVKDGLRRSDYPYTDPNTGEISTATTYYIHV